MFSLTIMSTYVTKVIILIVLKPQVHRELNRTRGRGGGTDVELEAFACCIFCASESPDILSFSIGIVL